MPPGKSNIPSSLTSKFQLSSSKPYKSKNKHTESQNPTSKNNGQRLQNSFAVNSDANAKSRNIQASNDNGETNNASIVSAKRIKACLRCRKSKVKCENDGEAPCKRCKQNGLECFFQMKIESYSSTQVRPVNGNLPIPTATTAAANTNQSIVESNNDQIQRQNASVNFSNSDGIYIDQPYKRPNEDWRYNMENRLENFGDTLNNILGFLKDGKFNSELPNPQINVDGSVLPHSSQPHCGVASLAGSSYPTTYNSSSACAAGSTAPLSHHHFLSGPNASSVASPATYLHNHYQPRHAQPSPIAHNSTSPSIYDYHDSNLRHPSAEIRGQYPYSELYYSSNGNLSPSYDQQRCPSSLGPQPLPGYKNVFSNDEVSRMSNVLKYPDNILQQPQYLKDYIRTTPPQVGGLLHNPVNSNYYDARFVSGKRGRFSEAEPESAAAYKKKMKTNAAPPQSSPSISDSDSGDSINFIGSGTLKAQGLDSKLPKSLKDLVSYPLFEKLYEKFIEKILPQLYGFDISKFDSKLIYVKSRLFVTLISLIGAIANPGHKYSHIIEELRAIYLKEVSNIIFISSKLQTVSGNLWGFDADDDLNPGSGTDSGVKSFYGNNDISLEVKQEYNDYIELCGEHSKNASKEWRRWNLLTKEEKALEIKKSKEFKLFFGTTALCVATFWLDNSQLLLGIALRLASELQLSRAYAEVQDSKIVPLDNNQANSLKDQVSSISAVDKLKLWFLLYISDSQQSFLAKKQLMMNSNDFALKHSRQLLFQNRTSLNIDSLANSSEIKSTNLLLEKEYKDDRGYAPGELAHISCSSEKTLNEKLIDSSSVYSDLRLVSQLEFNQALGLVLGGNAWGLLSPDLFGIPWKTNLELDKWMVHWTCYLTPIHQGNSWSIKSAMIYYNFARMYINNQFKKLLASEKSLSLLALKQKSLNDTSEGFDENSDDEGGEDTEESFDDYSHDLKSDDIALLSAQTLIIAMTSDKDLIDNLLFAPLHIYVMLYYSAIVLLDSDLELFANINTATEKNVSKELLDLKKETQTFEKTSKTYLENIILVRSLLKVMSDNLPIDKDFGIKLIKSLKKKLDKKYNTLRNIGEKHATIASKNIDKIRQLDELDEEEIKRLLGRVEDESHDKGQILAWPGINHQHP